MTSFGSPLDHVLLLFDAVSFVCDMAFVFDMVHVVLLVVEVLQDARVPTVVFHAGPELLKRQIPGGKKSFCRLILSCSILSCLWFFLAFNWLIHDWYDACVSSSLSGVRYCYMGLFTFEFDRGAHVQILWCYCDIRSLPLGLVLSLKKVYSRMLFAPESTTTPSTK